MWYYENWWYILPNNVEEKYMRLRLKLEMIIMLLFFGFALSSCSNYQANPVEFIFKNINDYGVNDEFELSVDDLIIGSDLNKTTLFFSSSDNSVAEICGNCLVKCKNVGQVVISATITSFSGETIIVRQLLNVKEQAIQLINFSVKENYINMRAGEEISANSYVDFAPSNYIYPVTLTSSNDDIITIENNTIVALTEGEASVLFSVKDYLTQEEKVQELKVLVEDKASFDVENLIDNTMVFSALSSGKIKHNFHSSYFNSVSFSTDSELLTLSSSGDFEIGEQAGRGNIILRYETVTGEIGVISYNFEIIEPPTIIWEEKDCYFTNCVYSLTAYGKNLQAENFIFNNNIEIIENIKQDNSVQFVFKFLNNELSNFSLSYSGNYSYTFEEVIVLQKEITLYDESDIEVSFNFFNQCIDKNNNEEIVLYLLNESFENISHPFYAKIVVNIGNTCYENFQISIDNEDCLCFDNNQLHTLDREGESEITIVIYEYELKQRIVVKKLLVKEIELQYKEVLYLNSHENSSTEVVVTLDCDYAYNAHEIKLTSLSPEIVVDGNNTIKIISVNEEGTASFEVQCGNIIKTALIGLGYHITEFNLLVDDELQKENTVQLNVKDRVMLSCDIYSGNMLITNIKVYCILKDYEVVKCDPQFIDFTSLIAVSGGQVVLQCEIKGNYSGITTSELIIIVS